MKYCNALRWGARGRVVRLLNPVHGDGRRR